LTPDFVRFQVARSLVTLGIGIQSTSVAWQVYEVTGSQLDLGLVGLVQFLPALLLILVTGHVADRFDRRRVILAGYAGLMLAALMLLLVSSHPSMPLVYGILLFFGAARAFLGPPSQAIVPDLVPVEQLQRAFTIGPSVFHAATIGGMVLGGAILWLRGRAEDGYGTAAALYVVGAAMVFRMRVRRTAAAPRGVSLEQVTSGLRYVFAHRLLLGAISVDLFATLLGGAVALLPVFAKDILDAGPQGLGAMRAAPAAGAVLMGIWLAHAPIERRAGRAMLIGIVCFGLATIGFGLSRNLWLSLLCLAIAGGADMISVVVRHTLVQLATPPELRGRVSAVNSVFITTSNELGEFESGLTAQWFGTVPAVVIGGIGSIAIAALWAWRFAELRHVDRLADVAPARGTSPSS
jgi:MFS family permease